MDNIFYYSLNNRNMLREVTVKIELERIDTQKEVEAKRKRIEKEERKEEEKTKKEEGGRYKENSRKVGNIG